MKAVTVSARIPEELNEQLTLLSQALRRNRSWVIEEALRGYIASEQQFLEAVEEGLCDAAEGRVVEHHEVVELLRARRQHLAGGGQ